MARKDDDILDLLSKYPWWVSIIAGVAVYIVLKFIVPSMAFGNPVAKGMAHAASSLSVLSLLFVLPAGISALKSFRNRRRVDQQSGIHSIRSLSWKEFEALLAEAYRRQGYAVQESSSTGPDGGIDLQIRKNGNFYLVQCKQWRSFKVGAQVVREMFGLMTAHNANGAIIVTSGMFTQEAKNFSAGKPIDLVEGNQLVDLVRNVQRHSPSAGR